MIEHLRIQLSLGLTLGGLVLLYHFIDRVVPGISASYEHFDPKRCLPYLVVIAAVAYLLWVKRDMQNKYQEFISNSPGVEVDTTGIQYGIGHAHPASKK